jgi:uncharacterized delta-60 repeat protein
MAARVSRPVRWVAVVSAVAGVFVGIPPASAAPGDLDKPFNGTGQRITTLGPNGSFAEAHVVIHQGEKILVAGSVGPSDFHTADMAFARYTRRGRLDRTFSGDGKLRLDFDGEYNDVWGLAALPNGKILAAGTSEKADKGRFGVIRLTADGRLDKSFGGGDGKVFLNFGPGESFAVDMRLVSGGKFLVCGGYQPTASTSRMALARFMPDGHVDTSFGGGDGRVTTAFPGDGSVADAFKIAVMSDGRIVLAGDAGPSNSFDDLALVRYRPNGTLDPTFSGDGRVRMDLSPDHITDAATGVAPAGNGKVVVGAYVATNTLRKFGLVRFKPNGAPDPTFGGGDGVVLKGFGVNVTPRGFARQPDGKLLGVGQIDGPPQVRMVLVRWNPGGAVDKGFGGGDGVADPFFPPGESLAYDAAVQSNGKIVLAGYAAANATTHGFGVERFLG